MQPRDYRPGELALIRVFTHARRCALTPVKQHSAELGFLLAQTTDRCRERGHQIQVYSVTQRLDGFSLIAACDPDPEFLMREWERLHSQRISHLTGVSGSSYDPSHFDYEPLLTAEDFWDVIIETHAYPVIADLVRYKKDWQGLRLGAKNLGSHPMRCPELDLSKYDLVAAPRPSRCHSVEIAVPDIVEMESGEYVAEFRQRMKARLAEHPRPDRVVGKKKLDRLTTDDRAPQPLHADDSLLAREKSCWQHVVIASHDPVVEARARKRRQRFLNDYRDCWEDVRIHGWIAFEWLVWPYGTFLYRIRFGAAVRGPPI